MKKLLYLNVADLPYLSGTLPPCLGDLPTLGLLRIVQTGIQGEIPWSRWMPLFVDQGSVVNSRGLVLHIESNPNLFGRATPEEFPLMENGTNGTRANNTIMQFGCQISKLKIISQPDLSGNLSSTIARCTISQLIITDVSLTGDLPLEICEICSLEHLEITGTNLSQKSIDAFNSQCNISQHIDLCWVMRKEKELPYGNETGEYKWLVSYHVNSTY